jgi:hypothetical protein
VTSIFIQKLSSFYGKLFKAETYLFKKVFVEKNWGSEIEIFSYGFATLCRTLFCFCVTATLETLTNYEGFFSCLVSGAFWN